MPHVFDPLLVQINDLFSGDHPDCSVQAGPRTAVVPLAALGGAALAAIVASGSRWCPVRRASHHR